ncbi:hypothetical protein C9374_010620 [Naegleria lovaniensis]|uniref:Small ribosomal subunit protein mS29 n=1 Tax=Naegleria lovaniensis TaxID=51637 RepID=A0AA88KG36_NAELO|nr:uncharacterized protein C9374_010620 [Naegleria lovaniensis]KAG2374601.1 hypothetical protein C9374_010620 [Naegleria lovaniensis]
MDKHVLHTSEPTISLEDLLEGYTQEERRKFVNRTCVFKNSLFWQGYPAEMIKHEDGFYFLLRKEAIDLMEYIDQVETDSPRISDLGKALFGSPGTGKSSLLFFISNYCHKKGWVVLYWLFGSNSISERYVSHFLKDNPTYTFNPSSSRIAQIQELLKTLYSQHESRVLVAIDQWNVFLTNLRTQKNTMLLEYFNTFQTSGDLTNGVFIGALSSQSFFGLPLDVFPDASKQSSGIVISPYTSNEFKAHMDLAIHCKMIKSPPSLEQLADYQFETGGIPRLLLWMLSSKENFNNKVKDYYIQRMKKFIERYELTSPNNSKARNFSFQDISVSVYLNKSIICSATSITPWLESGLLVKMSNPEEDTELDSFDAPCPIARSAIYACLTCVQDCTSLIQFLITDKQTKRRALELLFLKPFTNATHSSPVSMLLKSIDGVSCDIEVTKIVHQQRPHRGVYQLQKITRGTLMICHDDHQLIDFYAYNLDGSHVFIHVSHMSYTQYCNGDKQNLRLLWEDIVKKKRKKHEVNAEDERPPITHSNRMKMENGEVTVCDFYRLCSGCKKTAKLTKKDRIVYLTTSDVAPSKKLDRHVIICNFEQNASKFSVAPEFIRNANSDDDEMSGNLESGESQAQEEIDSTEPFMANKTPKNR